MVERSLLANGRFRHDLSGWTASGATYSAGDGDDHYGVAVLETGGEYISQQFAVTADRLYTLFLSVKAVGAALSGTKAQAIITDGHGNTVKTINLTGTADTWTDNENDVGLVKGGTYTLKIINNNFGADVRVDDVWLWFVPIKRSVIAAKVDTKLGALADAKSYSTAASGSLTEGSYTYAIDTALELVGAVNPETGKPDVRYLSPTDVKAVVDAAEREMLEQLANEFSAQTDVRVGQRDEKRSQIAKLLAERTGQSSDSGSAGTGTVTVRKLHYSDDA